MSQLHQDKFLQAPYAERRLIVVVDDAFAPPVHDEQGLLRSSQKSSSRTALEYAVDKVVSLASTKINLKDEALKSYTKAKANGVNVLPIGKTLALSLIKFPIGHPMPHTLYVGNPALPDQYYTMADFHRMTFEHKYCEAIDLLSSLGASKLRLECIKGSSKELLANLGGPLGGGLTLTTDVRVGQSAESHLVIEASYEKIARSISIPENLIWFQYEPTWQSIAKGRLERGLHDFALYINYVDDFGVNVGLKAALFGTGLNIGGNFESNVSTILRIEGKFADML